VPYEWGRVFAIGGIGALTVAAFYVIDYLRGDLSAMSYDDPARHRMLYASAAVKLLFALGFPALLLALGFYDERERRRLAGIWQQSIGAIRTRSPLASDRPELEGSDLPINPEKSFDAGD